MKSLFRLLASMLMLLLFAAAPARAQQGQFLDPDVAFRLHAAVQGPKTLTLSFDIADGYYLYQERFHFVPQDAAVKLGTIGFPPAHRKFDPNLGHEVAHYRKQVAITLPVSAAPARFKLKVTYQGCSDQGLCYPPIDKIADVSLAGFGGDGSVTVEGQQGGAASSGSTSLLDKLFGAGAPAASAAAPAAAVPAPAASGPVGGGESARIGAALAAGSLARIIPMFLLFGLLLAFTPCVLPMIPILSSIIVGHGERVSRGRGFALALSYSLGMALVYTAFGVAAGLLGEGLAAALQNPWVLSAFAALLVLLSLSMFGFYELQVPAALQSRLSAGSDRLRGGAFAGVFLMGGISALIVGPCVAAPLAGALLYIGQTGNALTGGVALFSLAMGMSVPLLIVGVGAGALLPRAGGWMNGVKAFFGVLLLATALYMVGPVLPDWLLMLAWAALLIVSASFLHVFDRLPEGAGGWARLFKGLGVVLALAGAALIVGMAAGNRNLLQPLQGFSGVSSAQAGAARFTRVADVAALDRAVAASSRPVMLDFYADWCVSCKELEHNTFPDPRVASRMAGMTLLQADVTANTDADKALLKRFSLFGPPGIIFFRDGREIGRVVGYEDAATFVRSMQRAGV
ncbi:thiol:disulfide interchange protein DsbD precursor [mine drainage metagenome]|uniref:Thiol:disulfide interchange protein DsbD n=1 Tax=mine drainage metagenome TaxID=410659 RepID=A0A1J5QAB3_9ZZZZ